VSRLLSKCRSRCRGVNAAVEVLRLLSRCEAAVEVSRLLSRCQGCCRGFEAAVEVLNSCRVPWRLTLFLFNNPVVLSAGIVGFVKSEVLAFLIPPKAAVEVK
jgi:hypothetical protein